MKVRGYRLQVTGDRVKFLGVGAFALLLATGVASHAVRAQGQPSAQQPARQPNPAATIVPQLPTFSASVDLVTTDAMPRDIQTAQFIADLNPGEFAVYEDGVKQALVSVELVHGGRASRLLAAPVTVPGGITVAPSRPTNDTIGRIFLVFIDDLHLDFQQTPRLRTLLRDVLKNLIHDGDTFGVVSTGTSSIAQPLTDNRQILESISNKVSGGGLKPSQILDASNVAGQAGELRHRAHVTFSTAYDLVNNLEKVKNRRKAVIYVSSGYDFNPIATSQPDHQAQLLEALASEPEQDPFVQRERSTNALNASDLIREEAELIRATNRASATLYTIDPRGLVAQPYFVDPVNVQAWNEYVRRSQDTLRMLAENTGGFAIVDQSEVASGLARIDAEASDYYVLGYYSNNPDQRHLTRTIDVEVTRPNIDVKHRPSYTFRRAPAPPAVR